MDLVRDLLDKQVIDRNGRELGRVDSVILDWRDGAPPIVSAIEIGLVTVCRRLHPLAGRIARAVETLCGVEDGRPVRVPFARIIDVDKDIKLDLTAEDTAALAFEQKARAYVSAIPGAS